MASTSATAATASASPRKGRHARSQAMVNSWSASSSTSFDQRRDSRSLIGATSVMGLPPGLDPVTLDPDEALTRFSVREAQAIETSLRASHDVLTTRLRSLVSERYRDMLGTANTLIEMSTSSTNLVQRLDNVLDGVQRAGKVAAQSNGGIDDTVGSAGLTGVIVGESEPHDSVVRQQSEARTALFAVAAVTKLVAEAPDEVWKAIDAATQASETGYVTPASSTSKKEALKGRELSNFQAATILRAAWIFTLAEASWAWLTAPERLSNQLLEAEQQFPFIARQRAALMPMRSYILSACTADLCGWMDVPSATGAGNTEATTRWNDVSASYLATITSLISLALLEGLSLQTARERLLQSRRATLYTRLHHTSSVASHEEKLVHLIHFVYDTLVHTFKAFALPQPGVQEAAAIPHLAAIYARLQQSDDDAGEHSFPPLALSVLHTLPTANILTQHLPHDIQMYAPQLATEEEDSRTLPESTLEAVQHWTSFVHDDSLKHALARITDRLTTIAAIGEVQSTIWAGVDRCCAQARKTCCNGGLTQGQTYAAFIEQTLHALVSRIDDLLMKRLNSICQAYGDQLSSAVIKGTREALENFDTAAGTSEADEVEPALFLFESSISLDNSTLDALERKLRIRTKHVQDILSLAEEKARAFASETRAYSKSIRRAEARRAAGRRAVQQQNGGGDTYVAHSMPNGSSGGVESVEQDRRESGHEMLASFDASLQRAKTSITLALRDISDELMQSERATTAARLFLARLVSALRRSSVFLSGSAKKAPNDEGHALANDLQAVYHGLLDAWVALVSDDAVQTYKMRDSGRAGTAPSLPQSPSAAMLDALAVLSRGAQAVGVGYRSEATWLRSRLTAAFAIRWLGRDSDDDEGLSAQRLFDVELLATIAGLRSTPHDKADAIADDDRIAAQAVLRKAQVEGLQKTGIDEERWSSHCATHLQATLARVRLIVAGITVDESVLTTMAGISTGGGGGKGANVSTSVPPPLPMLRLAKAREPIPRVRPIVTIAASR